MHSRRAGTRSQEVDFNPALGKWQPGELGPPGGGLLACPAWAGGKPGSRGRPQQVTGRKQMEAREEMGSGN